MPMVRVRATTPWKRLFARVVAAVCVMVTAGGTTTAAEQGAALKPLVAGVWIAGQISPEQVDELKAHGIDAVVDLRPDGEAPDQPSSGVVEAAALGAGVAFSYAPVAGSEIPAAAVDAVSRAILRPGNTVLLYCRSGRRAARAWALAEASRTGGLDAEAIAAAANSAGQPVDNLREQIAARVATRIKLH